MLTSLGDIHLLCAFCLQWSIENRIFMVLGISSIYLKIAACLFCCSYPLWSPLLKCICPIVQFFSCTQL